MKNVLAVLTIAAGIIAALTMGGGGGNISDAATQTQARPTEPASTGPTVPVAVSGAAQRWEYRVVNTRAALLQTKANARATARLNDDDPHTRFIGRATVAAEAEADVLRDVERELNRLGAEGWEMCSASDGALVFRRSL